MEKSSWQRINTLVTMETRFTQWRDRRRFLNRILTARDWGCSWMLMDGLEDISLPGLLLMVLTSSWPGIIIVLLGISTVLSGDSSPVILELGVVESSESWLGTNPGKDSSAVMLLQKSQEARENAAKYKKTESIRTCDSILVCPEYLR